MRHGERPERASLDSLLPPLRSTCRRPPITPPLPPPDAVRSPIHPQRDGRPRRHRRRVVAATAAAAATATAAAA